MAEHPSDRAHASHDDAQRTGYVEYPTDHVLGVLDTEAQVTAAAQALTNGGFLTSEIRVATGRTAADRLGESTGRSGLAGLAIRIAESLGIDNDEMALKSRYEDALRAGHFVVAVATPTQERKDRASELLREHGAHTIASFGRFTITAVAR
jgi:hypothetical protein